MYPLILILGAVLVLLPGLAGRGDIMCLLIVFYVLAFFAWDAVTGGNNDDL